MHKGEGEKQEERRAACPITKRTYHDPSGGCWKRYSGFPCLWCVWCACCGGSGETNGMHQDTWEGKKQGDEKHASGCLAGRGPVSLAKSTLTCVQAPKHHHGKLGTV